MYSWYWVKSSVLQSYKHIQLMDRYTHTHDTHSLIHLLYLVSYLYTRWWTISCVIINSKVTPDTVHFFAGWWYASSFFAASFFILSCCFLCYSDKQGNDLTFALVYWWKKSYEPSVAPSAVMASTYDERPLKQWWTLISLSSSFAFLFTCCFHTFVFSFQHTHFNTLISPSLGPGR